MKETKPTVSERAVQTVPKTRPPSVSLAHGCILSCSGPRLENVPSQPRMNGHLEHSHDSSRLKNPVPDWG